MNATTHRGRRDATGLDSRPAAAGQRDVV